MDNARIHHVPEIQEVADRFGKLTICTYILHFLHVLLGVRVIYPPAYSPDLNPIEEALSKIKFFIRMNGSILRHSQSLFYDLDCCIDIIAPEDAHTYFRHAGYIQ